MTAAPLGLVGGHGRRFARCVPALAIGHQAAAGDALTPSLMRGAIRGVTRFDPIKIGGGALGGGKQLGARGGRPNGCGLRIVCGALLVDGGPRGDRLDVRIELLRGVSAPRKPNRYRKTGCETQL
jgi:hypothetical protein